MRDKTVKERLGLGNTISSQNSNRKKFWPVGRSTLLEPIEKDDRGDLTTFFGVFPLFTTHKKLKTTVAQKLNSNETYQKQI